MVASLKADAPKSFTPALARIYRPLEPWAYAVLRIGTAAILMPHGAQKLFGTAAVVAGRYLPPWGLPATPGWAMALGSLELAGGALLGLGFLTRPVALLFVIELFYVTFLVPQNLGWAWVAKGAAEHHAITLLLVCLAFLFRGGGRYSLDRLIGKEF